MNDRGRYIAAAHAMQSGVMQDHALGGDDGSPKHLRVGINTALADQGALVRLLVAKGLITEEEYLAAIADAMEDEQKRYEEALTERMGVEISLA